MNKFLRLLGNEQVKIYIRKSTWVMYISLAVIIIAVALITRAFESTSVYTEETWQETLEAEHQELMEETHELLDEMENVSEDSFFVQVLQQETERVHYHLEHDIMPLNYGAWSFVLDNTMLLPVVTLLTIIIAASIVANEYRWGTIKLLLIRPVARATILASKYVSVLVFACATLLFVLVFSWISGAIILGVEGWNPVKVIQNRDSFIHVPVIQEVFNSYGFRMINLVMMATFAFMISVLFRNSGIAIGVAIFLMMAGQSIVAFFSNYDWSKYILFANTNLEQFTRGVPTVEGMTMGFSIAVLLVYYAIFIGLTWLVFTKRDVVEG